MTNWCKFLIDYGVKPKIKGFGPKFSCSFDLPLMYGDSRLNDVIMIEGYGETPWNAYDDWIAQQFCHLAVEEEISKIDQSVLEKTTKDTSIFDIKDPYPMWVPIALVGGTILFAIFMSVVTGSAS